MSRSRSPNYPSLNLAEAIEAMRPIFQKDGRNAMSRLTVAQHLGYNSLNGRSMAKIGALRAYNLLEGSGDTLKVSDGCVALLRAPEGSPERAQALRAAFNSPPLFAEIETEVGGGPISKENLVWKLDQKAFTPEAAHRAAETFLESRALVSGTPGAHTPAPSPDGDKGGASDAGGSGGGAAGADGGRPRKKREVQANMKEDIFTLKEGEVVFQWPDRLSPESYEDLESWTQLILRKVKRHVVDDELTEMLDVKE